MDVSHLSAPGDVEGSGSEFIVDVGRIPSRG